jgi:hypothetical protein
MTQFPVARDISVGRVRGSDASGAVDPPVSVASGIPFAFALHRDRGVKKIIDSQATIKCFLLTLNASTPLAKSFQ